MPSFDADQDLIYLSSCRVLVRALSFKETPVKFEVFQEVFFLFNVVL